MTDSEKIATIKMIVDNYIHDNELTATECIEDIIDTLDGELDLSKFTIK